MADPRVIATPTRKSAWNQFDEHGLLLGLSRLPEEKNWKYKRRLLDTFAHRANSSYLGLVYGITRELGLELSSPISINPKLNPDGSFLPADPLIKFDGVYVYLYSDYSNGLLDYQIDRWQPGGNYEHLTRFVDLINTTAFFEASLLPGADPWASTMTIINQSSNVQIMNEAIPASNRFQVKYPYVVPGSMYFSDINVFRVEVFSIGDVIAAGRYFVDYQKGIVTTYNPISIGLNVTYSYTPYLFKPLASPVILSDINNDNFKVKMFQQVLLDDGTYTNGTPTELGVDSLNELYSVYGNYFGV